MFVLTAAEREVQVESALACCDKCRQCWRPRERVGTGSKSPPLPVPPDISLPGLRACSPALRQSARAKVRVACR